jgi:GT2 family glycosyltransferase
MGKQAAAAFLNYKRHDLARSMAHQLAGARFPVYAFDNGGGLAPQDAPDVQVVSREDNLMFAGGWNWAMGYLAAGEAPAFVWMLNDDVEGVSQGMLAVLVGAFPEDAAAVTPAFNSPHSTFRKGGCGLREVSWVDWCCPLVRMEAWADVGPFDRRFLGYGADLDWCKRARDRGWTFYVHDGLEVRHLVSATALSQGLQRRQGNVAYMNQVLREKWGVGDWSEMVTL